jgi:ribosome recycling factor
VFHLQQLQAVPIARLQRRIGNLTDEELQLIRSKLVDVLHLVPRKKWPQRTGYASIRRDGNKLADQAEKDKDLSEDERDDCKEEIQELTKTYETKANDLAKAREKEVMEEWNGGMGSYASA